MTTILDSLERHARLHGDREFLVLEDERITFGELAARVWRLAGILQASGVGRGDRVVLFLARRTRYLTAYLAAMAAGAIPVHLYPERPATYVDFAASHTGAALVITDQEREEWGAFPHELLRYPEVGFLGSPVPRFLGRETCGHPPEEPRNRETEEPSAVAYMMFTSGTTGQPKAVMTTQANVLFVTRTLIGMAGMTESDREVIVMPLGSTGGLGHFHSNLVLGNRMILMPYFFGSMTAEQLEHVLETIAAERITGFLATPGLLGRLATQHRQSFREKARGLRYVLSNVCPVRPELVRDLMELLPNTRFHTYYGLTEASRSVHQCYNDHPAKVTAAGRPSPGVSIRIGEPDGAGVGEVLIQGGNVMAGYWNRGRDGFDEEGFFHTGDLGSLDADGFLTIRGRLRDNINVDGLKFLPREVEDVLLQHPAVADCAVVGLPDPIRFQRAGAMIVPKGEIDPAELQQFCRERLDFFKVPATFCFADAIPRSELGKVDRAALIERMT